MKRFNRKRRSKAARPHGVADELDRLFKTARRAMLGVPLLMVAGFGAGIGAGSATTRALELPAETPVRDSTPDAVTPDRLEAIGREMARISGEGEHTEAYALVYRHHVRPVEEVLTRRGMARPIARRAAWPLVEQTRRNGLDVATVLSVIHVESNFRPNATSSMGARGLMQVMPIWLGVWRECGRDLYDIDDNLCNGTSVLAWYMRRYKGNFRRAMLGYNGCVHGINTPDCHRYPDRVARVRAQISRELDRLRGP
ncbi:MAG: lytic transglycosylase domain-containing protein [Longimicrobiales bacterium]